VTTNVTPDRHPRPPSPSCRRSPPAGSNAELLQWTTNSSGVAPTTYVVAEYSFINETGVYITDQTITAPQTAALFNGLVNSTQYAYVIYAVLGNSNSAAVSNLVAPAQTQLGALATLNIPVQPVGTAAGRRPVGGRQPIGGVHRLHRHPQECGITVGEQVDPANGDVSLSATDIALPGSTIPLVFTRSYDAQAAQSEAAAGTAAPALGYGWSDNLGVSLAYNTATQTATVTEDNGAQVSFAANFTTPSPYTWCPTPATNSFCPTTPRVAATLTGTGTSPWVFTRTIGNRLSYTFTAAGVLTQISDPLSNALTASTYSPGTGQTACPTGDNCQAWTSGTVANPNPASAQQLVIATTGGRVDRVFDANSSLAATYTYTGTSCTPWTGGQTRRPVHRHPVRLPYRCVHVLLLGLVLPDLPGVSQPGL